MTVRRASDSLAWASVLVTSRRPAVKRLAGLSLSLATLTGGLASCAAPEAGSSAPPSDSTDGSATDQVDARDRPAALGTPDEPTTATTERETTDPATTEPATTAAPTTTAAPISTLPPITTPPATPRNRVPVAPAPTALVAVGGRDGAETTRVQQRLLELGFWLAAPNGSYDLTTQQAVMAFQKYLGLPASGDVDEATAAFLSNVDRRAFGKADSGTLVEIDKTRQLLFFVIDGTTKWVLNTSTGNGEEYTEEDQNSDDEIVEGVSLTPDGFHQVDRERVEGWWEGDLGEIYRPKYFVGGVAVHGSNSVPNYPASHGCVRVTVQAMDYVWESGLMPIGLPVWVHNQPMA